MKPQLIALPLTAILMILVIGVWAGPLWVADATMPLRINLTQSIRSISGFGSWFQDIQKLRQDREQLIKERNQLLAKMTDLQSAQRENEALKKQINSNKNISNNIIMAHTAGITQQGNTSFLLIDKGRQQGVSQGQIVLSDGILVGRISQVSQQSALVQLPISLGTTVPAVIRHGQAVTKGVIEGNFNLTAKLAQVLPTDELHEGDTIETSADGGIYPPGIVIGKVGAITKKDNQLFQSAPVVLLWDVRKLEFVFVAK